MKNLYLNIEKVPKESYNWSFNTAFLLGTIVKVEKWPFKNIASPYVNGVVGFYVKDDHSGKMCYVKSKLLENHFNNLEDILTRVKVGKRFYIGNMQWSHELKYIDVKNNIFKKFLDITKYFYRAVFCFNKIRIWVGLDPTLKGSLIIDIYGTKSCVHLDLDWGEFSVDLRVLDLRI